MMPNPQRSDSDSENDLDYIPANADEESFSSSENEQPELKRPRQERQMLNPEEEEARKKDLWEKFQSSVNKANLRENAGPAPKKLVKVCKRYRFAGDEVTEVVEVPEDSPDAKKWPLWHPPALEPDNPGLAETGTHTSTPTPTRTPTRRTPPPNSPADLVGSAKTTSGSFPPPLGKRPGPRRPKAKLSELPGRSSAQATKLTTLDKSVMDWKAHLQSSGSTGMQEELEANRRGGGYLEKVEFLQRVDERKEAMLEATKSKRKRG